MRLVEPETGNGATGARDWQWERDRERPGTRLVEPETENEASGARDWASGVRPLTTTPSNRNISQIRTVDLYIDPSCVLMRTLR